MDQFRCTTLSTCTGCGVTIKGQGDTEEEAQTTLDKNFEVHSNWHKTLKYKK